MTPVEALQKALAAEHAAVHLYGLLGAQSSKSQNPVLFAQLTRAYGEHRAARDQLTALVSARGAAPGPTSTATQIQSVARTVERRVTRTYGELVAHTSGSDRRWAITALDASAVREIAFGVAPRDFPGLG